MFYQQKHCSASFLFLPPPLPFLFPLFFSRHRRNRPEGIPDPHAVPLSLASEFRRVFEPPPPPPRRLQLLEGLGAGTIIRRLPARGRGRGARDLTSRHAETRCVTPNRRNGRARSERTRACSPGCLTPASCLPASFGGEQPAAPTLFVSRVACLHVDSLFTRFPPPLAPRWSTASTPLAAWHRAFPLFLVLYHSPSSSVSLTICPSLFLFGCPSFSLSLSRHECSRCRIKPVLHCRADKIIVVPENKCVLVKNCTIFVGIAN